MRISAALVPMLVGLLALGGCGAPAAPEVPPPLDQALADGTALRDAVADALATSAGATWQVTGSPAVQTQPDGRCVLFLPDAATDADLLAATDGLRQAPSVLKDILAGHGYGEASGPAESNGSVIVTAAGPAGWKLEILATGKGGRLKLSGSVAADPCDDTALR